MLITGIIAGYLCWEKSRVLEGIMLLATVAGSFAKLHQQVGKDYGLEWSQLQMMMTMLVLGFLLFSMQYNQLYVDEEICRKDNASASSLTVLERHEYDDHVAYVGEGEFTSGKRKIIFNDYSENRKNLVVGTIVKISGELRIPEGQRNPGSFNYQLYLKSRNISYTMTAKGIQQIGMSMRMHHRFDRWLDGKKESFLKRFDVDSEARGFLNGVLFGERSELDDGIYQEFSENGTAHILAVSGLHVGFLIALLNMLVCQRKYWKVTAGIFVVLLMYGEITGWSPSTLRAVLIAILSMSGMYLRRSFDLTTGTAAAAMAVLLVRPYQLFQTGFIMSYLAIFGMAFLTKPLAHFVGEFLASLLSIQMVMIPFQIYCFHRFNPLTLAINIPIIFLASILVPCGVVMFFVSNLISLPTFSVECLILMTKLLIKANHFLYMKGGFSALIPSVGAVALIIFYLLLLFVNSEWCRVMVIRKDFRSIGRTLINLLLPAMILVLGFRNPFSNDGVVFVDVGQGAGVHLRTSGKNLLVDGGGNANYSVGEKVLLPYFLGNGITSLDLAICTHLHMDHFKGVQELSEMFPIQSFAVPSAYRGLSETPTKSKFLAAGDVLRISDDLSITVLWPIDDGKSRETTDSENIDENELTGIYRIEYRGVRILVTGDILEDGESDMLQYYAGTDELKCDVLNVAHHGSKSSSSEAFLDAVNPRIAVIQVGSRNLYGHPHADTLTKLKARNITIYRTDQNGAIGLDIRKNRIKVDRMIE
jgi:competence protein ComEC